jgi:hypothetical protein
LVATTSDEAVYDEAPTEASQRQCVKLDSAPLKKRARVKSPLNVGALLMLRYPPVSATPVDAVFHEVLPDTARVTVDDDTLLDTPPSKYQAPSAEVKNEFDGDRHARTHAPPAVMTNPLAHAHPPATPDVHTVLAPVHVEHEEAHVAP